jgi:hypothetical protein
MYSTKEETADPLPYTVLGNDIKDKCFPYAGPGNGRNFVQYK